MREIKFRAWDTYEKRWLNTDEMPIVPAEVTDYLEIYSDKWIVFQQFTGLHDKNGKEIYEGDILGIGTTGQEYCEVVFRDGCFGINAGWLVRENRRQGINRDVFIPLNTYCNDVFQDAVEVIGNIYENPELLEVESGE